MVSEHRPSPRQLFVTGTARSGSTLLLRMLATHPRLALACDPFLFFFKLLRDAILEGRAGGQPGEPLQDFYYHPARVEQLGLLLKADMHPPFAQAAWRANLPAILQRMAVENPVLASHAARIAGQDFRQALDSALELVGAHGPRQAAWTGFKEVWIIPFLPALARSFPQARFVVIQRDPRGVIASLLGLAQRDPSQMAHVVSYLRHWRLQAALLWLYARMPLMNGRLFMLRYEDLVRRPQETAGELCSFLELELHSDMLDASRYRDGAGGVWRGNPASGAVLRRIEPGLAEGWRAGLSSGLLKLVELVCWPDMEMFGYAPLSHDPLGLAQDPEMAQAFAEQERGDFSWRSDQGQPARELGAELTRRLLLGLSPQEAPAEMLRGAFLFADLHAELFELCRRRQETQAGPRRSFVGR